MAETFSADWLALREPVDHRSRPDAWLAPLLAWWRERGPGEVLDLGSGTGSNLRWLAPRLGAAKGWTLVDHDPALLARAASAVPDDPAAGAAVGALRTVRGDLAREGLDAIAGADLVTASALLDLVAADWVGRLAEACASAGAAALFALTWDGAVAWAEPDPDDALVLDAVRAHQRRDKGLGPALGPDGATEAERAFRAAGYRTWTAESPWVLGADDAALALALTDGWAEAAAEQVPERAARVRRWAERRRGVVRGGAFGLVVGHRDVLALPPG